MEHVLVECGVFTIAARNEVVANTYCECLVGFHLQTSLHGVLSAQHLFGLLVHRAIRRIIVGVVIGVVPCWVSHMCLRGVGILILHSPCKNLVECGTEAQTGTPRGANDSFDVTLHLIRTGTVVLRSKVRQVEQSARLHAVACGSFYGKTDAEGVVLDGAYDETKLCIQTCTLNLAVVVEGKVALKRISSTIRSVGIYVPLAVFAPLGKVGIGESEGNARVETVLEVEGKVDVVGLQRTALMGGVLTALPSEGIVIRQVGSVLLQVVIVNSQSCMVVIGVVVCVGKFHHLIHHRETSEVGIVGIEAHVVVSLLLEVDREVHKLQHFVVHLHAPHEAHLVERGTYQAFAVGSRVGSVPSVCLVGNHHSEGRTHVAFPVQTYAGRVVVNDGKVGSECSQCSSHTNVA